MSTPVGGNATFSGTCVLQNFDELHKIREQSQNDTLDPNFEQETERILTKKGVVDMLKYAKVIQDTNVPCTYTARRTSSNQVPKINTTSSRINGNVPNKTIHARFRPQPKDVPAAKQLSNVETQFPLLQLVVDSDDKMASYNQYINSQVEIGPFFSSPASSPSASSPASSPSASSPASSPSASSPSGGSPSASSPARGSPSAANKEEEEDSFNMLYVYIGAGVVGAIILLLIIYFMMRNRQ
jgi:cobalamin biosynthesis Mg chelatase CobN